jgi:4-hydroxy-tetrahydrodipicolinate reductase
MGYRVAQWGTGNVGRHAMRCIIGHPDLELVGLLVHAPDKAGKDAGELCGVAPVGVTATNDEQAIIGLKPDCVSYMATGDLRPHEAVSDMCRMLEAGINVVSTSVVPLVYPPTSEPRVVAKLEGACRAGNTSCFTSGIDPGFANDLLPLTLLGACERVESVRVMEILNYDTYDQAEVLFGTMGFGQALDSTPLLLIPGALTLAWGGVVAMIAAGLGVELEDIRETSERRAAESTFDIPAGRVEAGTTAALRFEVQGIVGGRPAIVVEHVTRLHDDLAPDWPQPAGHGSYRILIEGSPSMKCELELLDAGGDHNAAGLTVTAMRVLNAIPAVCDAAPGLLSTLDLPLVTGRHLMRA